MSAILMGAVCLPLSATIREGEGLFMLVLGLEMVLRLLLICLWPLRPRWWGCMGSFF